MTFFHPPDSGFEDFYEKPAVRAVTIIMKKLKTFHQNIPDSPMSNSDRTTSTFQLILYMLPVVGFFPSLWTVYRRQGTREQLVVSRLSITLALTWMLGYVLLATGAEHTSDFLTLRLLILNTFLTSGYFLVCVWLIFRTVRGKTQRLPGRYCST
jgi:hypothetical protein